MTARLAGIAIFLCTSAAFALINVTLIPSQNCANSTVSVSLYAVSDTNHPQSIAAMDVILEWDPNTLYFMGIDPNCTPGYPWLFSGFPDDHNLDALNVTWTDGSALYSAWAQLGDPAYASPPPGLLVTTFQFHVLHVGRETTIHMPRHVGTYSYTVVYDGETPNLDVTGILTDATFTPSPKGDTNCDGVVNFQDINPFVLALSDPAAYQAQYPQCDILNCDTNCDGVVNFSDINPFVAILS